MSVDWFFPFYLNQNIDDINNPGIRQKCFIFGSWVSIDSEPDLQCFFKALLNLITAL